MEPQAVAVSYFSITNPTSRKIFVSSDMAPYPSAGLDPVQAIARVFSKTSNQDPHISRLQTQTRFVITLICDIETEIKKPISRKIVVSYDMDTDQSSDFGSKGLISQGFCAPFLLNILAVIFKNLTKDEK